MPEGIALNIGIKFSNTGPSDNYLREAFISSRGDRPEEIIPGPRAHDGSYSELTIKWQGLTFRVESASDADRDIVLMVTPLDVSRRNANVILETGFLWNRPGTAVHQGRSIRIQTTSTSFDVYPLGRIVEEQVALTTPYMSLALSDTVVFYTGKQRTLRDAKQFVNKQRSRLLERYAKFGENAQAFEAIQSVLAWNTIYDAARDRIITPVSRLWNDNFGGQSVLFCWDTYFGAYMLALEHKELAYANAIEITKSITKGGFVPNWAGSYNKGSYDRSQPPVGSLVLRELYRHGRDEWLLEYVFDDLLRWNRWWASHRDNNGFLCWGSTPDPSAANDDQSVNTWQGAAYESGLDNSPMFDNVPFNTETHLMEQADVGLMSLYVMDCAALADIANILRRKDVYTELKKREAYYRSNLQKLWSEDAGIFLNKRTDTGQFSQELSPTNFYPLLAKAATTRHAARMINEHLLNPDEFNGEWMLPSIYFKSKAFREQDYWRGRIWAPMNFLVYLGLLNYDLPEARRMLVQKSADLFERNRRINGWIFENYNAITGNLSDQKLGRKMGDNYYHWGALLAFISFIENGQVSNPQKPIGK